MMTARVALYTIYTTVSNGSLLLECSEALTKIILTVYFDLFMKIILLYLQLMVFS